MLNLKGFKDTSIALTVTIRHTYSVYFLFG